MFCVYLVCARNSIKEEQARLAHLTATEREATPLDSLKHNVHYELLNISRYRKKILRKLKTFCKNLSLMHDIVYTAPPGAGAGMCSCYCGISPSYMSCACFCWYCFDNVAGMSELLLQAIAESMEELVVGEGYVIIEQGDRGDAFFVLKEGTASVTVSTGWLVGWLVAML